MFPFPCSASGSAPLSATADAASCSDEAVAASHGLPLALAEARSSPTRLSSSGPHSFDRTIDRQDPQRNLADRLDSVGSVTSPLDALQRCDGGAAGALQIATGSFRMRTAADIVQDVFSMDAAQARRFLGQYRFEKNSLHNETSLALHLEQYEQFPPWAGRFRSPSQSRDADSGSAGAPSPKRMRPDDGCEGKLSLGTEIDEGFRGTVYEDRDNDVYVIKLLKQEAPVASDDPRRSASSFGSDDEFEVIPLEERLELAQEEAALFCRYYGPDAAQAISDGDDVYIRMLKVPGAALSSFDALPEYAVEKYVDMLENLNRVGIMHGDLHSGNVFYDAAAEIFYPIDFSNIKADYFDAHADKKTEFNQHGTRLWSSVIEQIQRRMPVAQQASHV